MKQPKALTRSQKEQLQRNRLNPKEWKFLGDLVVDDGRPTAYYKIINTRGLTRTIDRFS